MEFNVHDVLIQRIATHSSSVGPDHLITHIFARSFVFWWSRLLCNTTICACSSFTVCLFVSEAMKIAEQELPERQVRNATGVEADSAHNALVYGGKPLSAASIALSVFLFVIAGILEVGGGYLVWKGIRDKYRPELFIPMGCLVLCAYGFVPCLQPVDSFGRVFAIYGGFFIVLSYAWGYVFDGMKIDTGDFVGAAIALAGVLVCWFWPR